jgi:hypothetical protein
MPRMPSAERVHRLGSAAVWAAMWLGSGLILRGHPDVFVSVVPLLAGGGIVSMSLPGPRGIRAYLIGSLAVAATLLTGGAVLLSDTPFAGPMLALWGTAAFCLLVVMPVCLTFAPPPKAQATAGASGPPPPGALSRGVSERAPHYRS